MDKTRLLNRLEKAWSELKEAYTGLNEAQLTQPGVTGQWSVKDLLAHVATWDQEALHSLPMILEGRRPPRYKDLYGGIDAFNALKSSEMQALSLAETIENFEQAHQSLVEMLLSIPEEHFLRESRFLRRLRLDTYSHYPLHTSAIRAWRKTL
jgi:hypothetical protein